MGNSPKISVILCTVRDENAYVEHSEWGCLKKIIDDLNNQIFKDFELIVVDGLYDCRKINELNANFRFKRVKPKETSIWVRRKKIAISAYRNTGLAHASGKLCVNLDDCCELPADYLAKIWHAYKKYNICVSPLWPESGDVRKEGKVDDTNEAIYGFGSYPLYVALKLNGYDEAYDGSQGLEDIDWFIRLKSVEVKQALVRINGFRINKQSDHSELAIDVKNPIIKCANQAFDTQRIERNIIVANVERLWTRYYLKRLIGPCYMLNKDNTCDYYLRRGIKNICPYIKNKFPMEMTEEASLILNNPPIFNLNSLNIENTLID